MQPGRTRLSRALSVSVAMHAGLALVLIVLMSISSGRVATQPPPIKLNLFYFAKPGPSGGGGGSPTPAPARPIEVPPHRDPAVTLVPVTVEPPPEPMLRAPVETDAARLLQYSGTSVTSLAGPGGNGRGPGAGPGDGAGLGPGAQSGFGGGPPGPGGDVLPPTVIRSVPPDYTSEAMMAKIQGHVELAVVVLANGSVGDVRVLRSLDRAHGLDAQAIKAAKQWIFRPGTRAGQPVDVLVTLILDFTLH